MASTSAGTSKDVSKSNVKKSRIKCSFLGCDLTQSKNQNLHFFKFPVNRPTILEQWLVNCGDERIIDLPDKTLNARKVCEKHFELHCFTNTTKRFLKKDAVPTPLRVDHTFPEETTGHQPTPSSSTVGEPPATSSDNRSDGISNVRDTPLSPTLRQPIDTPGRPTDRQSTTSVRRKIIVSPKTPTTPQYKKYRNVKNRTPTPHKKVLTPLKRKLLSKLKSSEKKKKKFQARNRRLAERRMKITKSQIKLAIKQYLPSVVYDFVSMQLSHVNSPKKQWNEEEMRLALSMSYISPRLYERMRKDGFALPSKSTIARWLQEVDLRPGVCADLVNTMKAKVDCMTEWEKKSVIMFDEMQIKSSLEYDPRRDVVEVLLPWSSLELTARRGIVCSPAEIFWFGNAPLLTPPHRYR